MSERSGQHRRTLALLVALLIASSSAPNPVAATHAVPGTPNEGESGGESVPMLGSGIEEAAPVLEVVSALGLFWGETVLDALRGETASDPSDGGWVMAASMKRRLLAGALVEAVTLGAIAAGRALSGDETAGGA